MASAIILNRVSNMAWAGAIIIQSRIEYGAGQCNYF
jgi:hypothetical protein